MSGWIEWVGSGDCPVSTSDRIKVRYRNGVETGLAYAVGAYDQELWEHDGGPGDLVAFQMLQP